MLCLGYAGVGQRYIFYSESRNGEVLVKQRFIVFVVMLLVLLCMASCGHDEQDIHEMVYGIEYTREEAIELPREVLAGDNATKCYLASYFII